MWRRRDVERSDQGGGSSWLPPGLLPSAPNQSRIPAMCAVSILTCLLAAIFVGTRLYVNIRFKLPLKRDFWAILAAGIFTWAAGGLGIWGCTIGLGRHSGDISSSNYDELKNVGIALPAMTSVAASLAQCSILFFYLKQLSMSHSHRILTYLIVFISVLFCLIRVVSNIYHCHPNPAIRAGRRCIRIHRMWYAIGVIIMLFDLTIWALPIPPLVKWAKGGKMPQGIRIGVLATLGVGLLACIATMVRIAAIKAVTENIEDMPWHSSLVYMLDQLEVGLGIVAACMPSLRRLIGLKSSGDDQPRQRPNEMLPDDLRKETGSNDLKDMWMRDTIPPPPPRRFGGAIHFGPRGHLDLDIEGLGVLDSRLSGTMSQWQQQNIELKNMKNGTIGDLKAGDSTNDVLSGNTSSTITTTTQNKEEEKFDDGEITTDNRRFSFNRRGTGGSSVTSQLSSPDLEKYFPGSTSSKTPLRKTLSKEVLVHSRPSNSSRRDRSSDRDTASR